MTKTNKEKELKKIVDVVRGCRECPLWKNPKAVPGEGNAEAEVLLIGESPGYYESIQGKPFVGAAGKLLEQLLTLISLKRSEVFICNMLRHRPPNNRDPLPEEIKACQKFLDQQIKIIKPKIIVTLGRFSMQKFFPNEFISRMHGQARFVDFDDQRIIVIPMYHPAAALRNGIIKKEAEKDFLKIKEFLDNKETQEERKEEKKEQIELFK